VPDPTPEERLRLQQQLLAELRNEGERLRDELDALAKMMLKRYGAADAVHDAAGPPPVDRPEPGPGSLEPRRRDEA
jgi:hypothetical protein